MRTPLPPSHAAVHTFHGNSATKLGYGCAMPALVRAWREAWSATAGTTDPVAPFGLVSLSQGDSEGSPAMGSFRWSQSANYGYVPNEALPGCFLAHAYDIGDPWLGTSCEQTADPRYNCSVPFFMGPTLHPRLKAPVGRRLAAGAMAIIYNSSEHYGQPAVGGCRLGGGAGGGEGVGAGDGARLVLKFSSPRLRGSRLDVRPYNASDPQRSGLSVLIAASGRDGPARPRREPDAVAYAARHGESYGAALAAGRVVPPLVDPTGVWVPVHIALGSDGSDGAPTVIADLAPLAGATPLAVRYAWGGQDGPATGDVLCCDPAAVAPGSVSECAPAGCPIMTADSSAAFGGLPANPFLAKIVGGKCECPPPQVCDE